MERLLVSGIIGFVTPAFLDEYETGDNDEGIRNFLIAVKMLSFGKISPIFLALRIPKPRK